MKLSIITVSFNSDQTIADTLRSVDAQTDVDLEHLIVDGASSDDTLAIVSAHAQPWRRVLSERDRGIYDAMNKGIALSQGDIVGFINSDDFYPDCKTLSSVVDVFRDEAVDACYGDLCYVRRARPDQVVRYWRSSKFTPGIFRRGWCPPHPTLFIRRDLYIKFGAFDINYRIAADMELMARFMERHRINARYLPKLIVKMRTGGASNNSLSDIVLQNFEIWRALKLHGLRPAVVPFVAGKLLARSRQFLSRPA
jgi:glycosyltransferase involved in cell wall biosynthesis